jgi:hypothetical protein
MTIKLTEEQIAFLKVALNKAMDNENDAEYNDQFSALYELLENI